MAEKRRNKRFPRRMTVRYGDKDLARQGITHDVSIGGSFVLAQQVPAINSRIHLQFLISGDKSVYQEALVLRHRLVPPHLRSIEKGGFAVRFLSLGELLEEIVPQVQARNRFEIVFYEPAHLKLAYDKEIKLGGVFMQTESTLPKDSRVFVEIRLEFAGKSFEFPGRVVQGIAATSKGLAIAFEDRTSVQRSLEPFLAAAPPPPPA